MTKPPRDWFLGVEQDRNDPERAGVVIVPVPFERTSSFGRGSSAGPSAIVAASHEVEVHDTDLGFEPRVAAGGIATLPALRVDEADDGRGIAERLERAVGERLDRGQRVVTLAGEHTGVVGAIAAHVRRTPGLTVLQLDAHSDLRPSYQDDPWNHACTMARVLDFHGRVVQVGIRSECPEDAAMARDHGIPVFHGSAIQRAAGRGADWIAPIIEACAEDVYVTFDCDVLDPSIMPATGTPEPGGLTWLQVDELLTRLCRERHVVGFDLSELAPIAGLHHPQFTAAKLVYRFIGLMARGREPA